ncbi:hypothetical protein R0K20_19325, partial [Staphylococcus sp. SIMBA_130]
MLRELLHGFYQHFGVAVCIGVGRPYKEAEQFVASYREALHTVRDLDGKQDVTYAFYHEGKSVNVP